MSSAQGRNEGWGRGGIALKAWARQFVTPTIEDLLSDLPSETRPWVDTVRSWLDGAISSKPTLVHFSGSWSWTEQRSLSKNAGGTLQDVFLILEPERPRLAVHFQRRFFEHHSISELHKVVQADVRDGVCVGRVVWVECPVQTELESEGVCALLDILKSVK